MVEKAVTNVVDCGATTQLESYKTQLSPLRRQAFIVQELCESRGGRPGLSVLTSLLVSVDVKIY